MADHLYKTGPAGHKKRMIALLRENARRHRLSEVFSDFCEVAALSFSNAVDLRNFKEREARYLQIVGRYEREEVNRFPQILACLTSWMECAGMADCMGDLFMSLELGDNYKGQFFTPYEVSKLMARLTVGDELGQLVQEQGFIRMSEPTCGAGGMVIACAETLHERGFNYQQCMHVTTQDIDSTAVHMTYLQLTLLHVPAVVIHGNTLSMECRSMWFTAAHVLGGWGARLRATEALRGASPPVELPVKQASATDQAAFSTTSDAALEQLALF